MTDNILNNQFSDKYSLLPNEVQFFLSSDLSGKAVLSLAEEYKLPEDDVYSLVFLMVNSNFDFDFLIEKIKKLNLSGVSLKRFWLDYLGRLWLPVASYLEKSSVGKINIEAEFKKAGGRKELYSNWIDDLADEIVEENIKEIEIEIENYRKNFDIAEESEYIFNILSTDIINIFNAKSIKSLTGLNSSFIYLLFNEKGFKDEALRKMLNNKELISKEKIKIEDREFDSTISFWLKDFIKKNGSSLFDDLLLAQYLNSSDNTKRLDPKEKELLGKIINFYKNIAFFPESFSNTPPEKWKVFYFDTTEHEKEFERKNLETKNDNNEPDVLNDALVENSLKNNSFKEGSFRPENYEENEEIRNLKSLMTNYPQSSLERKAIEEEIRKLLTKK